MDPPELIPTLHLSHLLRILGPSSLTLYKHVLGRKRILIYTHPPVEAACILCHVAADMCFEDQVYNPDQQGGVGGENGTEKLRGRSREPINVLGMITLTDMDRLRTDDMTRRGWIACEHLFFLIYPFECEFAALETIADWIFMSLTPTLDSANVKKKPIQSNSVVMIAYCDNSAAMSNLERSGDQLACFFSDNLAPNLAPSTHVLPHLLVMASQRPSMRYFFVHATLGSVPIM